MASSTTKTRSETHQTTPVIGIMTQPISWNNHSQDSSYIAASYVKWLEVSGARSIAIPYDVSPDIVEDIFYQINGILLPGGALDILPESVKYLWKLIQQSNNLQKDDSFFPVWGTCLGFEWLIELACSNDKDDEEAEGTSSTAEDTSCKLTNNYNAENVSLPLYNIPDQSQLYPKDSIIRYNVENFNITMNNHHRGINPESFLNSRQLERYWYISSTNVDPSTGNEFVSSIEV